MTNIIYIYIIFKLPVTSLKWRTHFVISAVLPHSVSVPAIYARPERISILSCPNWCTPSSKPNADNASVTRTNPKI